MKAEKCISTEQREDWSWFMKVVSVNLSSKGQNHKSQTPKRRQKVTSGFSSAECFYSSRSWHPCRFMMHHTSEGGFPTRLRLENSQTLMGQSLLADSCHFCSNRLKYFGPACVVCLNVTLKIRLPPQSVLCVFAAIKHRGISL